MVTFLLYVAVALYLGRLTSISPCPLATNIAAISYIGRKVDKPRAVINAGLLYTLGRCVLYLVLAGLLTTTTLSIPSVSLFLQNYVHVLLGPIFLLLGMFLVGLITMAAGGTMMSERMQQRVDAMGIWGALLLGILFAVSFCPTSATWFFGLLTLTMGAEAGAITSVLARVGITLPAAAVPGGSILLPLIYGVGTALPVIVVAFLLAYCAQSIRLLSCHANLERTGNFAVEVACVIGDGRRENALVFTQLNVFWHSPRVPACAASPKRHLAAGNFFARCIDNRDGRDDGFVDRHTPGCAVGAADSALLCRLRRVVEASQQHPRARVL